MTVVEAPRKRDNPASPRPPSGLSHRSISCVITTTILSSVASSACFLVFVFAHTPRPPYAHSNNRLIKNSHSVSKSYPHTCVQSVFPRRAARRARGRRHSAAQCVNDCRCARRARRRAAGRNGRVRGPLLHLFFFPLFTNRYRIELFSISRINACGCGPILARVDQVLTVFFVFFELSFFFCFLFFHC
jgi:hypothetical protein